MFIVSVILTFKTYQGTCQKAKIGSATKLSSYVVVKGGEESVKAAIAKYGPCVTSLDVENGILSCDIFIFGFT